MQIYLNGTRTDAANATISAFDLGFTMGVTVTEQMRTFARKTPLIERHLDRFFGGLEIIELEIPYDRSQLKFQIQDLIDENGPTLAAGDELGIGLCATPGIASAFGQTNDGPTVLVYNYALRRGFVQTLIKSGIRLTSVEIQEISAASIPKDLKCRSRMHYYLAENQAQAVDANSRALLNDANGNVAEGTIASVVMIQNGRLVAPVKETVLSGVTLGFTIELAGKINLPVERRNISVAELEAADEVLWLTTPIGIVAVTHVNQNLIGDGNTGAITQRLSDAWHESLNG